MERNTQANTKSNKDGLKGALHELDMLAFGIYASRAELEAAKRDIARVRAWLEEMEIKKRRIEKRVL